MPMPNELTNTDKKIMFSDHDLLVRMNTVLDIVVKQQGEFITKYEKGHENIIQRVTALEINQAAHRQETKDNSTDIEALQKKSNLWDIGNSLGAVVAGALALFWGNK
jgi:chemotaxis response regulator CheB